MSPDHSTLCIVPLPEIINSNMYRVPVGRFRSSLTVFWHHPRACFCTSNANIKNGKRQDHTSSPPLDFSNTKEAYQSKSFREVLRHYVVFKSLSYNQLVDNSEKLLRWSCQILGQRLFNSTMKATVYGQFVAGEDLFTIKPNIAKLRKSGVRSILDYAVEEDVANIKDESSEDKDEEKREKNVNDFLSCINTAADVSDGDQAFAAIKLTGLARADFLCHLSEVIIGTRKTFLHLADSDSLVEGYITPESFYRGLEIMGVGLKQSETDKLFKELDVNSKGKVDANQWFYLYHFKLGQKLHKLFRESCVEPLMMNDQEMQEMATVVKRAKKLAECAKERGVCLLVDAEQTYFQPAISYITVNILMSNFNHSRPVVYNTIQCYLKEAKSSLDMDLKLSKVNGFHYGVKLVRGAYMAQERKEGDEDPIWPTKKETDSCYHDLANQLLQQVKKGGVQVMVATHNEQTVKEVTAKMNEYGISQSTGVVVFGQLLGMCDHVTFPLGQAGYCAYKYMPYGPVPDVLPYIIRRAIENRAMMAGADHERKLIGKELCRRLTFRK